jgi:hypothetical protein
VLLELEKVGEVDVGELPIAECRQHAQPERELVVAQHRGLVRLLPLVEDATFAGAGEPFLHLLAQRLR